MTIATPGQFKQRRSWVSRMSSAGGRIKHKRRVAAVLGLAGASKAQLRAVADQAYADWQVKQIALARTVEAID